MTSWTLTTREALHKELQNVRDVGFAVDRGENIEGVICIGAPIFDRAGHVLAAISASAPSGKSSANLTFPGGAAPGYRFP